MKTKLMLGLIVGMMAAAQIGSAQEVITGVTDDATSSYDGVVTVAADNAAAPAMTGVDLPDATPQQDLVATDSRQHLSSHADDNSITVARDQSQPEDNSFNWAGTFPQEALPVAAFNNDYASSPSSSGGPSAGDPDYARAKAGSPPEIGGFSVGSPSIIPEPNTVGLLLFGGSALTGSFLFRRKQKA